MAMEGLLPVVFTITPFLVERALEQIKVDLCIQGMKALLVSTGASYDYTGEGPTHHCPEDVGILHSIPGINIVVPGSPGDFEYEFLQAITDKEQTPWYFRLSQQSGTPGMVINAPNPKCLVIAAGPADALVRAALDFEAQDFSYINISRIRPLDTKTIRSLMCERVLIVEPYFPVLAQEIAALADYPVWIRSVGIERKFYHGAARRTMLDIRSGMTAEHIRDAYERIINNDH
jgi:transketolase